MPKLTRFLVFLICLFPALLFAQSTIWTFESTPTWQDEFNYSGAPLSSKWGYDIGNGGWGNNEAEYYSNGQNASVANGNLTIEARLEQSNGSNYTSARMVTKNLADFQYGRFEARIQLPPGRGTWPAFWMLPTDFAYGGWPNSGEIDIMEQVGWDPTNIHQTIHTQLYNGSIGTQRTAATIVPTCTSAFHVYRMDWTPDYIKGYVDSVKIFEYLNDRTGAPSWPFDKRFHILLNLAIGGTWGGAQGIDNTIFPAKMLIDYVRVYPLKQGIKDFLWTDFDKLYNVNYRFSNGALSHVANPLLSGNHPHDSVLQYIRSTTQYDVLLFNLPKQVSNLAAYKANSHKFYVKVFSPAPGTTIQFTLQDSNAVNAGYPAGRFAEFTGQTSTTNQWENIALNWVNSPDASVTEDRVNQLAILVNSNTTNPVTVYLDSLYGPEMIQKKECLWSNFGTYNRLKIRTVSGNFSTAPNPYLQTGSHAIHVAKYERSSVQYDVLAVKFDGTLHNLAAYRDNKTVFSVKVYSPAAGTAIQFTLQDTNQLSNGYPAGRFAEFLGTTQTTNQWETVTLRWINTPDASVLESNVNELAILVNGNTFNPVTIYFDSLFGPQFNYVAKTSQSRADNWYNFTVTNRATLTLPSEMQIAGTFLMEKGTTLISNCHSITGTGNFMSSDSTNFQICNPDGMAGNASGVVQLQGNRSWSETGNVVFNGTQAQVTGIGLPKKVGKMAIQNLAGVTLSDSVSVSGVLEVLSGSFNLDNKPLTLLSSAGETARLAQIPAGCSVTNANRFTVQRWLDTAAIRRDTGGLGAWYWLGSPVAGQTADAWQQGGNIYVSGTYTNTPRFGSVWLYSNNNTTWPQNAGWIKPSAPTDSVKQGVGARIWFNKAFFNQGATVSLTGKPVTGNFQIPVTYCDNLCAGGTATNGWNFVGNPYPSAIDWDNAAWVKTNVSSAIWVWRNHFNSYTTYNNGIGLNGGSNLVASGQGFMVEATAANPVLTASEVVKTAVNVSVLRNTAISLLRLEVSGTGLTDELVIADRPGTTSALEPAYDACKLLNPSLNIWADAGTVKQAIACQTLHATDTISIKLQSETGQTVALKVKDLSDWASRFSPFLHDWKTGISYPLTANGFTNLNLIAGNPYHLTLFLQQPVLGLASQKAADWAISPNPNKGTFSIIGMVGDCNIQILDVVGRVISERLVKANEPVSHNLSAGLYWVKVAGKEKVTVRKLVVE